MASISKIKLPSGDTRWESWIRRNGRQVAKRRFRTRKAAKAYATRIEGDADLVRALGNGGGRISFSALVDQYLEQYTGKAHSRVADVRRWADRLGSVPPMNIDPQCIKAELKRYENTPVPVFMGKRDGIPQFKAGDTLPKPASVNQKLAA